MKPWIVARSIVSYPFTVRMNVGCFGVSFEIPEVMLRFWRRSGHMWGWRVRFLMPMRSRRTMWRNVAMPDLSLRRRMLFTSVLLSIDC